MSAHALNIIDALDNLSAIVDSETLDDLELVEGYRLVLHDFEQQVQDESQLWVGAGTQEQTLEAVSKTFQAVARHLETFYQRMKEKGDEQRLVEGVNAVMVLVGEAAKKLERTSSIFQQYLACMPEYHQLQEFYRSKIIKEFPKEFMTQSVSDADHEQSSLQHTTILNDLKRLKDDQLYELFYLKTEDGYDFFTPALSQNIKLACDFGELVHTTASEDPLLQIKNWEDRSKHLVAKQMLERVKRSLRNYFEHTSKLKDIEIVPLINRSIMALMLASNTRHLLRQFSVKTCTHYMQDFILFLREVLHSREFQKLQIYPTSSTQPAMKYIKELVQDLVRALFYSSPHHEEIKQFIVNNLAKGTDVQHLARLLQSTQENLQQILSAHPNGPVLKTLDLLREQETNRVFDPLLLGNLPEHEATLYHAHRQIHVLRMGCPITQHLIHKAFVTEEFKEFIRGHEGVLLFVNLQDRTSWTEHARCEAIERLGQQAEFSEHLVVLTLPIQTDFYRQAGIYTQLAHSREFIEQLICQIRDDSTGFYFPEPLKQTLLGSFIEKLIDSVHKHYFDGQDLLNHDQRLVFISLVFNALIVKAWEVSKATDLALSSKDGLDLTGTQTLELCSLLHPHPDTEWMHAAMTQLFAPTLLYRERLPYDLYLKRTQSVIQTIEAHPDGLNKLGFKTFDVRFES